MHKNRVERNLDCGKYAYYMRDGGEKLHRQLQIALLITLTQAQPAQDIYLGGGSATAESHLSRAAAAATSANERK